MRLIEEAKSIETDCKTQIVGSYPQIVVSGTIEKPHYNIMYVQNKDGEVHLGFGSYDLANVFEWLEAYFGVKTAHVIDPESLRAKGRWECVYNEQTGETDVTCSNCKDTRTINGCYVSTHGEPLYTEDAYCPSCGARMSEE